jgi:hypothetical protein
MADCNYVTTILNSECIGDSLVKINNNFGNLNTEVCNILGNISGITALFASSLACLRLSLDPNLPVPTNDIIGATKIYVHPFQGNAVGLYSIEKGLWEAKQLPGVLSFNIPTLVANRNYDIYLWYNGSIFQIEFVAWESSLKGSNGSSLRTIKDGARVRSGAINKRFVGCMRTTGTNTTEMSFGRRWATGGSHPKFFLWNAQNQFPVAFSIFDNVPWNVAGPGDGAGGNNGPFSNFGYRSAAVNGTNYRVSFITGDIVQATLHQDHYQSGGWAYLTHGLNIEQSDSPYCVNLHRQGQFVSETQGQITHNSNFIIPEGYHFIQSLAMSYGGGLYYNFEGPISGGDTQFPGGRHSYGTTGNITSI